jgi:hypothetical protein
LPAEGAAMPWLVTNVQRFGSCVTTITRNDPARFSFVRRSSVGFTAIELHLLADWLESPDFPVGLNTFRGQTDFPKSTKPPVKD